MQLIDVKKISDFLNVKPSTIYQWAELGQIPCIKLNGALRFDFEDICKWICDCKREPETRYNHFTQAKGPRKGG